jgi:hypothetical protein
MKQIFLFKKLLFVCYLLITSIIIIEIGVRIWGYSDRYIYDPVYISFDMNKNIPYVLKPNLKNAHGQGLTILNTDNLGLRSSIAGILRGQKRKNEYRIAIAGDSITYGSGIERAEDTFACVLEEVLNQRQKAVSVQTYNFGVPAYSVKEMSATLEHRMMAIEPDMVIMAIVKDDLNLSRTPLVDKWGYMVNADTSKLLSSGSIIKRYLRKIHLLYLLRDIYITKKCWFLTCNSGYESAIKNKVPDSYKYITQFVKFAETNNLPYLIVLIPSLNSELENLSARINRDGINFIDLSATLMKFTPEQFKVSKYDGHPSVAVHREIGEILANRVLLFLNDRKISS